MTFRQGAFPCVMMNAVTVLVVTVLGLVMASMATAHETTRSYVTVTQDDAGIAVQVSVAFRDIEVGVWIDEDLDGKITWGETTRRADALTAYILAGLQMDSGGTCTLDRQSMSVSSNGGVDYLDLALTADCPEKSAPITVTSRLFDDIDPDHGVFLTSDIGGTRLTSLLSRGQDSVVLTEDSGGASQGFARYFVEGVQHLLAGADHLVFLLVLILPAVVSQNGMRNATLGVLAAVTGFTLSHALTLVAAATELLRPPSALIEVLIALSIVVTAADNLRPFIPAPRVAVAAFFGLIHGFGFATALGALQLTGPAFGVALLAFNLGIEVAQIGVVLLTMPALAILGHGRSVLRVGSMAAVAIGLYWMLTRLS